MLEILNGIETAHNIKFLIIDEFTERLIESLFSSVNDLLNYVTTLDRIDSPKRKGQPSVDAIYLLQPTKFNMNCIDADFSSIPHKYRTAHIRFLPGMEPHLLEYFHSRRYIKQNLGSLVEAKIGFLPRESQYFQTLNIDKPMQLFFNKNCNNLIEKNIKRTIHSLLNLCIITGEYPIIRFSQASQSEMGLTPSSRLAEKLAKEFQMALDAYLRDHEDFPPESTRPRAILLITDRMLDPFSPLLHDFSYQAMAHDLNNDIDTRSDVYHYKAENELGELEDKDSRLTDIMDPDWVELRHQHIVDANEYLGGKIKEMIAKNPLLVDRSKVKDTTDLLSVVAHLKSFDEERRRMILHKTLIESCLTQNQERKLAELAEVEQNLAGFGMNIDGEKIKHITDLLLEALISKHSTLTDKMRCILIYCVYRGGIIESDFLKLLAFIGVDEEHEYYHSFVLLFNNYKYLGFKLAKDAPRDKPFQKQWFHDTIIKDSSIYTTSRFIPAAGNILSKVIANPLLLSEESFPYVKDKPIELLDEEEREAAGASASAYSSTSLRNPRHKAAWTKNNNNLQKNAPRQRFFYYVIGGITYPEIKAAYDQSSLKNKDVFIGSDGILTPLSYMRSIEHITDARENLNLRDDEREKEDIPEFLLKDSKPVAKPVSHVHIRSHQEQRRPVMQPVKVEEEKPKEKKRHKFTKFLRSKDK